MCMSQINVNPGDSGGSAAAIVLVVVVLIVLVLLVLWLTGVFNGATVTVPVINTPGPSQPTKAPGSFIFQLLGV